MNKQATANKTDDIIVPKGYMMKADGTLVPRSLVSDVDLMRDDLVKNLVKRAKKVQQPMANFKKAVMEELVNFIDMSAEKYDAKMGGKKGNVTMYSFDGRFKVVRSYAENIVFDERLQVAQSLVNECIIGWAKGSKAEIKALVQNAFQTDREGNISVGRILGLKRIDIKDEKWLQAMQAISDSMQVAGTKSYIRFYERVGNSEEYTAISLDIAAL